MQVFGFKEPVLIYAINTMSEIPLQESTAEIGTTHPPVSPVPKRNRWQRTRRPPGLDHSHGFLRVQRDTDVVLNSTQSEVILFETPLISFEQSRNSGQASSSGLEPILESSTTASPELQGSQTPVFGAPTQGFQNQFEDDPWQVSEEYTAPVPNHIPRMTHRHQSLQFDCGAILWRPYTKEGIPGTNLDPCKISPFVKP